MKRSEIHVGSEYAYSEYLPSRYNTKPRTIRCVVLGFEEATSGPSWKTRVSTKIRIKLLEGRDKGELLVTGTKLLWTWAEEQEHRKSYAREKSAAEQAEVFAEAAVDRVKAKLPFTVIYPQDQGKTTPTLRIQVHGEENIEKLLKVLGA